MLCAVIGGYLVRETKIASLATVSLHFASRCISYNENVSAMNATVTVIDICSLELLSFTSRLGASRRSYIC